MGWFFKRKSVEIEREENNHNNNACILECCDNQLISDKNDVQGSCELRERKRSLELWSQARKARCDQEQQRGGTTQMTHELVVNKSVGGTAIVNRKYVVLKTLGQGTYGKVKLCLNIQEYNLYALKIASKQQIIQSMQRHLSRQRFAGMQFQRSASSSQADNFRQARQQLVRRSIPRRSINSLPPSGEPSSTNASNFKVEDMVKEIAILKNLDHPNIVKLIEVIDDPNTDHLLMIMEYVEGGTLEPPVLQDDTSSSTCQKWLPMSESQTLRYVRDVILGLEYLHFNNIIHGDLKPQNLLISKSGRVKLADFGSAVMFSDPSPSGRGSNFGTPAFRAPETLLSGYKLSPELDMWALGVCVYQWIFGELPFKGFTPALVYEAIQTQQFEIPATNQESKSKGSMKIQISLQLADFMARLLDKDVTKRLTIQQALRHPWVTQQGASPLFCNGNAQFVPSTSCDQCAYSSCSQSIEDLQIVTNVPCLTSSQQQQIQQLPSLQQAHQNMHVYNVQNVQNVQHAQNVCNGQYMQDQYQQQENFIQHEQIQQNVTQCTPNQQQQLQLKFFQAQEQQIALNVQNAQNAQIALNLQDAKNASIALDVQNEKNAHNSPCKLVQQKQQQHNALWAQTQQYKRLRVNDRLTQEDVARAIQTQEGSSKLLPVMNTIFRERSYNEGEVLFQKGQIQDRIFLIANGEVLLVDTKFTSSCSSSGNRSSFENHPNSNLNFLKTEFSLISDQIKDDIDDGASDFLEEVGVDVQVEVQECYVPNVGALVCEQLSTLSNNEKHKNNKIWNDILEVRGPGEGLGLCQAKFFQNQQVGNVQNNQGREEQELFWPFSAQARGEVTCIEAKIEDVLQLSRQCEEFQWEISNLAWAQQTDLIVAEAMRYLRVKVEGITD